MKGECEGRNDVPRSTPLGRREICGVRSGDYSPSARHLPAVNIGSLYGQQTRAQESNSGLSSGIEARSWASRSIVCSKSRAVSLETPSPAPCSALAAAARAARDFPQPSADRSAESRTPVENVGRNTAANTAAVTAAGTASPDRDQRWPTGLLRGSSIGDTVRDPRRTAL